MWYEDTNLLIKVSDGELTPKNFVKLYKEGKMRFTIVVEQIGSYPPVHYANITFVYDDCLDDYLYVFNPGREVWQRLEV